MKVSEGKGRKGKRKGVEGRRRERGRGIAEKQN